ncbi:MAG: hypothetical protein V4764_18235 [Burkholderia sp.]
MQFGFLLADITMLLFFFLLTAGLARNAAPETKNSAGNRIEKERMEFD